MPYPPTVDPGILPVFTNVKQLGAVGDGVTDDTTSITNAINVAHNAGGGIVYLPPGTYITGTQLLYSDVHIIGAGIETTTLKLKSGTNADLLQGTVNGYGGGVMCNVSAANDTGSTGGVESFSVRSMTLDGNKAGQSSGTSYCMRFYGLGFLLQDLVMKNGYSGGLLTDWNGGGTAGVNSMEAQMVNVKIHDCNAIGLEWAGPHDSHWVNVIVYNCGTTCIHVGPNASAVLMVDVHGFSPGQGVSACAFLIEAGYCQCVNCVSEGSDTVNTAVLGNDLSWIGSHSFGIVGNATLQKTGMQLGQQAGQTPFAGSVNQSSGSSTAVQVSGLIIDGNFSLNNVAALNFANETNNVIRATCYNTGGNVIVGTPNIQTSYQIYMNGLTPDGSHGKGGGQYHAIKANQACTWGDRTQDIVNLNTNGKKLELVNGAVLIGYTDNYSTKSIETLGDSFGTLRFAGDANATLARRAAGVLAFGGTYALTQGSVQVPATGDTVSMSNIGIARLNPAGNVTGIKLVAGSFGGQTIRIINESAFTIMFDIAANSFVADGTSDVIAANTAAQYLFDNSTNFWYRCV
jgi:hypothetical protein